MSNSPRPPRLLPWVVWGVAQLGYVIAILNRNSLAALGPTTQEHFGIDATVLSSFAVLQLIMYAAMQIPVGLLLDRYGVSIVLVCGGTVMFLGQLGMALAEDVWFAIAARVLVGAGDAGIFISVIRLLPDWFQPRHLPIMGQLTGIIGSVGQVIAVFPLAMTVYTWGWVAGFTGVAGAGLFVVLVTLFTVRDTPGLGTIVERLRGRRGPLSVRAEVLQRPETTPVAIATTNTRAVDIIDPGHGMLIGKILRRLRALWRLPGIRLAFWVHFTSPFTQHLILLLWGTPLLIGGYGFSPAQASTVLTWMVLTGVASGITLGRVTSRFASYRVHVIIGMALGIATSWAVLLLWPGMPPTWLVIVVMTLTATGGSASMVAFEVVRAYAPRRAVSLATGSVNSGGFIAALTAIFTIGVVLDLQGAGSPDRYDLDAFRWAFATMYLIWIPGITALFVELRNTRRWVAEHRNPG